MAKKMLDEDLVDEEEMAVLDGYYNPQDLLRTASNVDGTSTYVLVSLHFHKLGASGNIWMLLLPIPGKLWQLHAVVDRLVVFQSHH